MSSAFSDVNISISVVDGVFFSLVFLTIITSALRLYSRYFVFKASRLDDALIIVGLILAIGYSCVEYAIQRHINSFTTKFNTMTSFSDLITYNVRLYFFAGMLYVLSLGVIKLAIMAFFYRVLLRRMQRYLLHAFAALIVLWTSCGFIISFCYIIPFKAFWSPFDHAGREAVPVGVVQLVNSCFHALFDVIMLILPIVVLRNMMTSLRIKIGVTMIYLLGLVSLSATLVRLAHSVGQARVAARQISVQNSSVSLWTLVEVHTSIICANIPGCFALFRRNKVAKKVIKNISTVLSSQISSWTRSVSTGKTGKTARTGWSDSGISMKSRSYSPTPNKMQNVSSPQLNGWRGQNAIQLSPSERALRNVSHTDFPLSPRLPSRSQSSPYLPMLTTITPLRPPVTPPARNPPPLEMPIPVRVPEASNALFPAMEPELANQVRIRLDSDPDPEDMRGFRYSPTLTSNTPSTAPTTPSIRLPPIANPIILRIHQMAIPTRMANATPRLPNQVRVRLDRDPDPEYIRGFRYDL